MSNQCDVRQYIYIYIKNNNLNFLYIMMENSKVEKNKMEIRSKYLPNR